MVKMNQKEWMLLVGLVLGMGLIGTAAGGGAALSFAGLGLVIWVIWRGRKL